MPVIDLDIIQGLGVKVERDELYSIHNYAPLINGLTFFDIGASNGMWSIIAFMAGATKVIAFEAEPNPLLERNLASLFEGRYKIVNKFVTDQAIRHENKTSIDHWNSKRREKPGFIKLDVEGWEVHVLNGAIETIKEFHPHILVESHDYMVKNQKQKIQDLLNPLYGAPEIYPRPNVIPGPPANTIEEFPSDRTKHPKALLEYTYHLFYKAK